MHIHILGICGTFMGSLAQLALEKGCKVSGCDTAVYPPMSTQLEAAGIELIEGFDPEQIELKPDVFIVGNAISRGNPLMEAILDRGLCYQSGPQWLAEHVLQSRWVLAVSGTHGKTTTSSMLTWILDYAGMAPGYLIGGVAQNFPCSARLGDSDFFVIEADEYDTAFFDKRSKFIHYHARTLVVNNLEYDHADIFPDLASIQRQFHHLVRTVPQNGLIICPEAVDAIDETLAMGAWTPVQKTQYSEPGPTAELPNPEVQWRYSETSDGFQFSYPGHEGVVDVRWALMGAHNIQNAIHAIAAARHVGVAPELAAQALAEFVGVKRRLEHIGSVGKHNVFDDFAHHPTAIAATLGGLRKRVGSEKILAVIEPRSNTMKMGVHENALIQSAENADLVIWFSDPKIEWDMETALARENGSSIVVKTHKGILFALAALPADEEWHIVVMSNGGFANMPRRIFEALQAKESA